MERENRKRGREDMARDKDVCDVKYGKFTPTENKVDGNEYENENDGWEKYVVFDFPWLKEGVISKSEEWNIEDVFSDTFEISSFEFSSGQCLFESAATCMSSINVALDMFEENVWSLESVDDCTSWISLLNQQPIQQTLSNN